ncbi:c-type cytochrome [Altererythrobacter sp. Z27]|uniref:c-type cytochrome n=1 Tax=Altererythrobacter sp. Z27 TaxID=3461147 RepID=UPI004044C893
MKNSSLGIIASAAALVLAACGGESEPAATHDSASGATPGEMASEASEATSMPAADDVSTVDGTTLADFTGDPAAGAKIFMQCRSCHVVEPGVNRVGPSLAGIVGHAAGAIDGYNYTPANSGSGITWTPEKLFQYLENPRRVIPGTKMAFAGLRNGQDRADVIAYLQAPGE